YCWAAICGQNSGPGVWPTVVIQALVTGGSGFIGQHLVAALLRQGRRVRILDVRPPTCDLGGAQFFKGSILDAAKLREAITNVDEVYHLAALPASEGWHVGAPKARFSRRQLPWYRAGDCSGARVRGFAAATLFHRINSFQCLGYGQ